MPSKPTPPTTPSQPLVSPENTPDVVFGSSVGPYLKTLHPDVRASTIVAMMKIIAQVRQGHSKDPDLLRALTEMEILVQLQFTPNSLPKPRLNAYDEVDP
jgi:hypothetical protein